MVKVNDIFELKLLNLNIIVAARVIIEARIFGQKLQKMAIVGSILIEILC